ncbi:TEA domain-containing protein [Mycena sanguinolenta]|uniref:TEA domain-containing protein n=1 Tax=Mycena sanguinolenta TaxID=230812 RepID=A0A8H6ZA96_9AGAR|nr:TEA domain-containing protein [Mycena sanguinolenta]
MYYQRDSSPSISSSSASSSTPSTPASDLPGSPLNKNSWATPPMQSQASNEVLQSVLRVRKTWKTSRGGETVWPLDLEAALLEGLERYQPDDSRETRMLGRFPRRNRFISDYIFDKTGKRRSPKQVGSRLQQLRESCGGTQLLDLLSPFRKPVYPASSGSTDSALSSPISSSGDAFFPSTSSSRHTVIYIDILPEGSPDRDRNGTDPSPWSDDGDIVHASDHPRRLKSINPTVSFTAPSPIVAHSRFTVYSEDLILHAESVPLGLMMDQPHQRLGFLYSSQLVPKYWKVIVDSPDPTRFTIFQEVYGTESSALLFSATYKFCYKTSTNLSSPQSGSYGTRLDVATKGITSYPGPDMLPGARHPMYNNPTWNPAPQENSHMQRYAHQSTDSSLIYFPSGLPAW